MGFGCSFGPLMILSLHSDYINKYGAMVSMFLGGMIAALWQSFGRPIFLTGYGLDIPAIVPGFILSILFAYVVSRLTENSIVAHKE
jgi:sodium/proline symporter